MAKSQDTSGNAPAIDDEKKGSPTEGSDMKTKAELEVLSEIEAAREVQKQQMKAVRERKKVSGTLRLRTVLDPRKELVNLYVKDTEQQAPCFAPVEKKLIMVNRGYEPVLDKGKYVNHEGDILFVRPKVISDAEIQEADAMSKERLASTDTDAAKARVSEKIKLEKGDD